MSDRAIGFVSNVKCTRDKNGRVTIHWPEGAISTDISREMLDDMVDRLNERLWISVRERLPDMRLSVLCSGDCPPDENVVWIGQREEYGWFFPGANEMGTPTHWMPLPHPPEVK